MPSLLPRLYLIVDGQTLPRLAFVLERIPRGAALVQLRDKRLGGRALAALAETARAVTAAAGARLLVNDRVDVALAVGADGVHLPERGLPVAAARELLGPERLIGVSTHSPEAAARGLDDGADLAVLGPIWETPDKGAPLGPGALQAAAGRPIYALGGVTTTERAAAARRAGAHGIALLRALDDSPSLLEACQCEETCQSDEHRPGLASPFSEGQATPRRSLASPAGARSDVK